MPISSNALLTVVLEEKCWNCTVSDQSQQVDRASSANKAANHVKAPRTHVLRVRVQKMGLSYSIHCKGQTQCANDNANLLQKTMQNITAVVAQHIYLFIEINWE